MPAAARDVFGLAVLPCYLCSADERLVQLGDSVAELARDLWLLTHPDLRRAARIRSLIDFIAPAAAHALSQQP